MLMKTATKKITKTLHEGTVSVHMVYLKDREHEKCKGLLLLFEETYVSSTLDDK